MKKMNTTGLGAIAFGLIVGIGGTMLIAANQNQDEDTTIARWNETASRIIRLNGGGSDDGRIADGLGRFDSRTGQIDRLNGDVRMNGNNAQWVAEISGVGNEPVGTFRLDATHTPSLFMTHAVSGETWVLRKRGIERWEWVEVDRYSSTITATGAR